MTDGCMGCRVPGYSHAAYCPEGRVEELRSRLAEAELARDSWKREAELNQQAADESAGYARRLAEAEALLMELNQRPRHFEGGVYWLRTYTGDYERIARIVAPDSASGDTALEPGEEWWMDVAGVPVKLDEWEPGAKKRKADQPGVTNGD